MKLQKWSLNTNNGPYWIPKPMKNFETYGEFENFN